MIFLSGPRQAGKTTLARMISEDFLSSLYFNWDILEHKKKLMENPLLYEEVNRKNKDTPLIIFDEIHKYRQWKSYLKSAYDRDGDNYKFFITGSGRLDIFRKGGESLAGRYLLFYLWPFTLAELSGKNTPYEDFIKNPQEIYDEKKENQDIWNNLARFSGFPDPYLTGKERYYRNWSNTYRKQLLREDIRDSADLRNFDSVEILYSLIPSKIGSPLSMAGLARDVRVSFDSIKSWLGLFEKFFLIFRISPWTGKLSRAISKEKKAYLYDFGEIDDPSIRFENMAALELLRAVNNWNNRGLGNYSLYYVRNREKEEVDFLIADKNKPVMLVETKLSDESVSKSLRKFQLLLNVPAIQLVNKTGICRLISNEKLKILVISASRWLSRLP